MKNELYSAILKSISGRLSVYLVQFIFLTIYARLFNPEQFGIIASIQVFVVFFQMLADIGIGPAIINDEKLEKKHIDGIFSFTILIGICLAIFFYISSFGISYFYNSNVNYSVIALIISISIIFNSLNIVPITTLNKDADFLTIAKNDVFSEIIAFIFVYILYVYNFGVLALAYRYLFSSIIRFLLTYKASINSTIGNPKLSKNIFHVKRIFTFASYQFGFNVINYFSRNLDNILVGKFLGFSVLGIYDKSYQLMRYPLMITTFAMNPAIQPILTKYRDNKKLIVVEHNLLAKKLVFISLLISSFMYINAYNIVYILFGDKWLGVIPLIKIFSFMIPLQAILSTSGSFFLVMNKPKLLFISGSISAITNISGIVIGIYFKNIEYIAISLLISLVINFFQCYVIMFKYCFNENIKGFLLSIIKTLIITCLPILTYYLIRLSISSHNYFSIWNDFILNVFIAILSLTLFFIPLKKDLIGN